MSVPGDLALTDPVDPGQMDGSLAAVQDGINSVNAPDEQAPHEATATEKAEVRQFWKEFNQARDFDKAARKQFAVDASYAAGTADITWAVNVNIIGSHIDVLSATLYARDPDVSITKAPQVDETNTTDLEDMAKTGELVVSRLWKDAKLKKRMRKMVRSTLSVSHAWMKGQMVSDKIPQPTLEAELNDAQQNLRDIEALQKQLDPTQPGYTDPGEDETAARELELRTTIDSINKKLEVSVKRSLALDYIPVEDIQVSLDVASIEDYLDADWIAHITYMPQEELMSQFSGLTQEDIKTAKLYYRKQDQVTSQGQAVAKAVGQTIEQEAYTSVLPPEGSLPFGKIVERWNRRTGHIETGVEGIAKWAVLPFPPPYQSSRFYSFFYLSFFEVVNSRFPQSLSYREAKLQDEYACTRSNFREVRERSFPGIIVNAGQLADTELEKLKNSKNAEIVALKPTDPMANLQTMFAEKPISRIDPRLYDTAPILNDMDRISGVQQAQSGAVDTEKTATEAEIQQGGYNVRTTANRDMMESMLSELAQYTMETSMQCLPTEQVQKMVGTGALWPEGMSIDEILQMWVVEVEAGSSGKPKNRGDREAWATVMPLLADQQVQIAQLQMNPAMAGLAQAKVELVTETMRRMGDDTDVSRFIPKPPQLDPLTGLLPGAPPGVDPAGGLPPSAPPGPPGAAQPPTSAPDSGSPVVPI